MAKALFAILCLLVAAAGGAGGEQSNFYGETRLILVGGEIIDTRTAPQVSWKEDGRRDGGHVSQWYVHVNEGANLTKLEEAGGMKMGAYVPHNTYVAIGTTRQAAETNQANGVLWVGVRPERHKIAGGLEVTLEDRDEQRRRAARGDTEGGPSWWSSLRRWMMGGGGWAAQAEEDRVRARVRRETVLGRRQQLFVMLVPLEERAAVCMIASSSSSPSCEGGLRMNEVELAALFQSQLADAGVKATVTAASETKLLASAIGPGHVADIVEYLAHRLEVSWVEHKVAYSPLASGATRIIRMGPEVENKQYSARETVANQKGLVGTGQVIGIADTGIDWDNCMFWESAGSALSPEDGQPPPIGLVDATRRKIISYMFDTDCKICGRCAVDIEDDSVRLGVTNGIIMAGQAWTQRYPAVSALSAVAPRSYDAAGASISFDITAKTQGVPSQYISQGAGSLDIPVEIQMFILTRKDTETFDVKNPDYTKCLNGNLCRQTLNRLQATDLQIPASVGGYGIIIVNRGLGGLQATLFMQGSIQFRTAIKPCGDEGDDASGHGTHVAGVAAGRVFAPVGHEDEVLEASEYDGLASDAKIFFTDLMQNADPACNIPEEPCARVGEMSVPIDIHARLFPQPYAAGARVHLNSWGCTIPPGESAHYCNNYTTHSMEIDRYSWENKDFLVVNAVGDIGTSDAQGTVSSPATCKNCLSVGSTHLWNDQYRKNVLYRDPQDDVCKDCQFPKYCSRSNTILGSVVNGLNKENLINSIPRCCNDTIHTSSQLVDVVIPPRQLWTQFFPNRSTLNPSLVSTLVKSNYNWRAAGASLHYDFTAAIQSLQQVGKPLIQVFVLNRRDYIEYFEDMTASCLDDATFAQCRRNPCVSSDAKQVDGSESCFSLPPTGSSYQRAGSGGSDCARNTYNGVEYQDAHCHIGGCTKEPRGSAKWTDGCPLGVGQCCNDKFLQAYCLNQPCTQVGSTLSGITRHTSLDRFNADLGYGFVVRNMGEQAIKVSGKIEIHNPAYPCTLLDCCSTGSQCCSTLYKLPFGTQNTCDVCPRYYNPGECTVSDHMTLLKESARGPAMSNYNLNQGSPRYKPDLVAPGHMVVSANSDGNRFTNGAKVQCAKRPSVSFGDLKQQCNVGSATDQRVDAALAGKTGTSIAAALVAGAVMIVREYFMLGYYPEGIKDIANVAWKNPSAALVRALLVNSARTVGGSVDVYTFAKEPPCLSETGECAPWRQPPPTISTRTLRSSSGNWLNPNMYEGFGRPILANVLNFAGSSQYSMWIREGSFDKAGMMDTFEFPLLKADWSSPLKVTLAWTDPPATLGASQLLVNDLDLIVQLSTIVTRYDINLGVTTTKQTFVVYMGNIENDNTGFSSTVVAGDSANTIEQVVIQNPTQATNVTVIVVSKRLSARYTPQPYSLVVTGLMRPHYHSWNSSRDAMLQIVGTTSPPTGETDKGVDAGFDFLDVFKTSKIDARNLQLKLGVDALLSAGMVSDADEDKDGTLSKTELAKMIRTLRIGNRRPKDPTYGTGVADPVFLGKSTVSSTSLFSDVGRVGASWYSLLLSGLLAVGLSLCPPPPPSCSRGCWLSA